MESNHFDVVIVGGAFSGASTGLLLRRERPGTRVLILERRESFDAKVGEATTEMSGMFLTRRLALWQHLESEHLPKEGLRYWFVNDRVTSHANASETGSVVRSPVPSFQLRRDILDEHILELAAAEGCEVVRGARVGEIDLQPYENRVGYVVGGRREEVTARWVVDATGRSSVIGRKLGLIETNDAHPIGAIWARWRGVRHLDDLVARAGGELAARNVGSRRLATNHYMAHGRWIWVIPLGNGETSIGVVYDPRRYEIGSEEPGEAYRKALASHPPLAELLEGAEMREDDFRVLKNLAYRTRQYMGPGWALAGDAAVFLDPFYSPGLDHACFSVEATTSIILEQLEDVDVAARIDEHNRTFLRSYDRFFEAIFRDKYEYMGEHDLMTAAFLLDTAQYYIFVVIPAYRVHRRFFWMPVLGPKPAFISYRLMTVYNRRLGRLARLRRETGQAGKRNDGSRLNAYFNLDLAPVRMLLRGLRLWMTAEIDGIRLLAKRAVRPSEREPDGFSRPRAAEKVVGE